ncbi:hypothetical protein AOLI_G00290850 [Acnodon oligacanthus]
MGHYREFGVSDKKVPEIHDQFQENDTESLIAPHNIPSSSTLTEGRAGVDELHSEGGDEEAGLKFAGFRLGLEFGAAFLPAPVAIIRAQGTGACHAQWSQRLRNFSTLTMRNISKDGNLTTREEWLPSPALEDPRALPFAVEGFVNHWISWIRRSSNLRSHISSWVFLVPVWRYGARRSPRGGRRCEEPDRSHGDVNLTITRSGLGGAGRGKLEEALPFFPLNVLLPRWTAGSH